LEQKEIREIAKNDVIITADDDKDSGFIDFLADIEETFMELTELMNNFGEETREIAARMTENTTKIQEALNNQSQGTTSNVRKIARKNAESMNIYGTFLNSYNQRYEELWSKLENSMLRLLESKMPINSNNDLESFTLYINTLSGLKGVIVDQNEKVVDFLKSIVGLKGMQKDISRSATLVEIEIKRYMGLLDKSVATIERVTELGNIKIKEWQQQFEMKG
jgi:hypothetical protein